MNVTSGGPHILLFERDQQLTTLLSGELTLAGYEAHTARTAVEVFDAIARFPVRLVMVNLAQAQAGRREFWVALDAQRRGRGVQVFTFRCTNLAGYGPEDPDERVDTVLTDLEVDGMLGIVKLVDAVRARVPGSTSPTSAPPARSMYAQEMSQEQNGVRPSQVIAQSPSTPGYPVVPPPVAPPPAISQPLQGTLRPQPPPEMYVPAPSARPVEPPRSGHSTFTDKIRAVIYPSSRNVSSVSENNRPPNSPGVQAQYAATYQNPDAQPRPQASQRFAEADYPTRINQEDMLYQSSVSAQSRPVDNGSVAGGHFAGEESSLDQLTRMLRENFSALQNTPVNGHMQNGTAHPAAGLSIDPHEIQEIRAQILHAARQDEAHERANMAPSRSTDLGTQLRASPIQDRPFEHEAGYRRAGSGPLTLPPENQPRPAMTVLQPTQAMPPVQPSQPLPVQSYPPAQASPVQPGQVLPVQNYQVQPGYAPSMDSQSFATGVNVQMRPALSIREVSPEAPISVAHSSQVRPVVPPYESSPGVAAQQRQTTGPLSMNGDITLPEQVQARLQQTLARRPEVRTSDDMLLDIVKSLPPMAPASQPSQSQEQVLNGRATRSLGSVLLEGHLVPQERLQVAQHVQRMLRGVDLNYQLGEILLMFKLLTPDQLLAASLVSYGMISTVQISALGRIRQELHTMGLEYDLESLVILFRILTPEQMREVRASWSS